MRHQPADFWAKVDIRGPDDCWLWKGHVNTHGYGDCYYQGVRTNASRIAFILANGRIPKNKVVCHSCDVRLCCNPAHLWSGTQGDNVRDCVAKGRGRGQFSDLTGADHPRYMAVLTPEDVLEARRLHFEEGVSQSEIARRHGVNSGTICRAVNGNSWSWLEDDS